MITREELYALVWSIPVNSAAARLGVSNIYLAKVCVALNVPRPPLGWWRKVAVGVAPAPPPLPPAEPGLPCSWRGEEDGLRSLDHFFRLGKVRKDAEDRDTHPLVYLAAGLLRGARQSDDGTHLVPRGSDAVDLTCSPKTLDYALSLTSILFKRFNARGHPIRIAARNGLIRPALENSTAQLRRSSRIAAASWAPKFPTIVDVGGVPIGIAVMETTEEVLMRYIGDSKFSRASVTKKVHGITWTEWQHVPTGRFKIVAYSPHFPAPWQQEWVEARRNTLRAVMEAIVVELEDTVHALPHAGFFRASAR